MKELFTLGDLFVSDFLAEGEIPRGGRHEMKMMLEEKSGLVRLEKSAPLDTMYGKYWYRSGINNTMRNELKGIVDSVLSVTKHKENDIWIDIASNDGTLLSFVPPTFVKVGIDPVDDSFKSESEQHSDLIIQDYFSSDVYKKSKFGSQKAKVVTSIAVFYDIEDPNKFIRDVSEILDEDGLWVLQLSYTPLMIEQMAFDNICHEHIYYYSLFNLKEMMEKNGFRVVDCQLNDINGGSFRVYVMKESGNVSKFGTRPHRDVCDFRVKSIVEYEKSLSLDSEKIWKDFFQRILDLKEETVSFIKKEKSEGKKICGYGASTKGNTLLQYFGLDHTLIDSIAERSKYKWGLKTVGTNIPIISEEQMRKENPDYLLVLPWHFINEFTERESEFLSNGGKFIVPCPKFEIIGK